MACQDDKVKLIADGVDLYVDVATRIFDKSYGEIVDLGKKSRERTTGKVISLSSIYGTGHVKLKDTLRVQGGVRFNLEETARMTRVYREDYDMVVAAWNAGREVLDTMYQFHSCDFLRPGILQVTPIGIMKPSGLLLTYPDLKWTKDPVKQKEGYTYEQKRKTRDWVYGSKVYQRCIQSLARDIIAEQMLKIDKRYRVVGTLHDEIICVVPEREVEEAKDFVLSVMRTPPSWAPELPLDAEVGIGSNYGELE
jgi:DNA polymerase